jgi:SSS family solute:Na+ symporter
MSALVIGGGLAALMSTMDSQLLTLSSMVVRDGGTILDPSRSTPPAARRVTSLVILLLAVLGLALALRPWAPILDIATETFTGLAVLFPITLAGVYWKKTNAWAGFASILAGEALVVLYHFKLLPAFGLLPVIPVTLVTTLVLVVGSLLAPARNLEPLARLSAKGWRWTAVFGFVFLLGNDFWAWHRSTPLWLGLPFWMWYYIALTLVLFLLIALMLKTGPKEPRNQGVEESGAGPAAT